MLYFWGGGRFDISQTIFKTNTNLTAQLQTQEDPENLNTYIVFNEVITKDCLVPCLENRSIRCVLIYLRVFYLKRQNFILYTCPPSIEGPVGYLNNGIFWVVS